MTNKAAATADPNDDQVADSDDDAIRRLWAKVAEVLAEDSEGSESP